MRDILRRILHWPNAGEEAPPEPEPEVGASRYLGAELVRFSTVRRSDTEDVYVSQTRDSDAEQVFVVATRRSYAKKVFVISGRRFNAKKIYIVGAES